MTHQVVRNKLVLARDVEAHAPYSYDRFYFHHLVKDRDDHTVCQVGNYGDTDEDKQRVGEYIAHALNVAERVLTGTPEPTDETQRGTKMVERKRFVAFFYEDSPSYTLRTAQGKVIAAFHDPNSDPGAGVVLDEMLWPTTTNKSLWDRYRGTDKVLFLYRDNNIVALGTVEQMEDDATGCRHIFDVGRKG